ncbi:MAG: hypothetical protein AAFU85_04650 [Planctomycetota bacterium]
MKSGEISYDLVMDDDMEFIEGAYRLHGKCWQVFVTLRRDVDTPIVKEVTWDSGITGVNVFCPRSMQLNAVVLESLLGDHHGVSEWNVVRGPDSMILR